MAKYFLALLLASAIIIALASTQTFVSPCPEYFTYETQGLVGDHWFGNIVVRLDAELSGIWMRVVFDRPVEEVGTEFGEAVRRESNEFLIKRPSPSVAAGETVHVRLWVRGTPGRPPPQLIGFRLNAETRCPASGTIPPTTPEPELHAGLVSPCPSAFSYDLGSSASANTWTGNIHYTSEVQIEGVWMAILFDGPATEVLSDFGEVEMKAPNRFLVKKPVNRVLKGEVQRIQLTVRGEPGSPAPKLTGFRQNGRTVCPEEGSTSTAALPGPAPLVSPCPNVLTYDPPAPMLGPIPGVWNATLHLLHNRDLNGVWLRIELDRPAIQLGNYFSLVKNEDNTLYKIQNRDFVLKAGVQKDIRFFIKFNTNEPVPVVKSVKLNAEEICAVPGAASAPVIPTPPTQTPSSWSNPNPENIPWITWSSTSPRPGAPPGPDFVPGARPPFGGFQRPDAGSGGGGGQGGQCGVVSSQPVPLLTYAQPTIEGRWPWHAALYQSNGPNLEYYCGGVLVSLRFVLTAAHCAVQPGTTRPRAPEDIQIYLSKYRLSKFTNRGQQSLEVDRIFIHPEYKTEFYKNDIGMLRLAEPAQYTSWVRPVCLWSGPQSLSAVAGREGIVVGWGYNIEGRISDILLQVAAPIVTHKACRWSSSHHYSSTLTDRNFCAGFRNGTSVCTGDSGGGLYLQRQGTQGNGAVWEIRGLVSVSVAVLDDGRCDPSYYAVYTDVAKYLDWIRKFL